VNQFLSLLIVLICGSFGLREQTFRTVANAVSVDVSVTANKKAVLGLAAKDFLVLDNGVPQTVSVVTTDTLPIDVTILLDVSFSTDGPVLAGLTRAATDISKLLLPRDRIRLILVTHELHEAFDFAPAGMPLSVTNVAGRGATSLLDGLVAGMLKARADNRRHLLVAITDGRDTLSFFDSRAAYRVALLSDAVVQLLLARDEDGVPNVADLGALARATGGDVRTFSATAPVVHPFSAMLREFRLNYVIYYVPVGVPAGGWHDISVTIPGRPNVDVRARKGYLG
jgi:VWFA-related protein